MDWHFFSLICCKNWTYVCFKKTEYKRKRGREWPIFKIRLWHRLLFFYLSTNSIVSSSSVDNSESDELMQMSWDLQDDTATSCCLHIKGRKFRSHEEWPDWPIFESTKWQIFLTKVAQIFGEFYGYFEKCHFYSENCVTFGRIGLLLIPTSVHTDPMVPTFLPRVNCEYFNF